MPAPTTPVGPAQASVSLAKSMDPGIAKAVGIGYLGSNDPDASVVIVSGQSPLPARIVSGSQTDALTNDELRSEPVVSVLDQQQIGTVTVSQFTSEVSAELYGAQSTSGRVGAIIFVPEETPAMHILFGNGTVSSSNRSYTIQPGGAYQVPATLGQVKVQAILTGPGTAFLTLFEV